MGAQNSIEEEGGIAPREVSETQSLVQAPASQPISVSPLDLPVEQFRAGLDRRRENRSLLMEWVRAALVEGVDYGRIHVVSKSRCRQGNRCQNPSHLSKPSLFKPGAEKICGMLGVTVHYPTLIDNGHRQQSCPIMGARQIGAGFGSHLHSLDDRLKGWAERIATQEENP